MIPDLSHKDIKIKFKTLLKKKLIQWIGHLFTVAICQNCYLCTILFTTDTQKVLKKITEYICNRGNIITGCELKYTWKKIN